MSQPDKTQLDWLSREWHTWNHDREERPDLDAVRRAWDEIVQRHAEPHRHYHTLAHIYDVLNQLWLLEWWGEAVPYAAILHDIIYDPRASDNEERSAELARGMLASLGLEEPTIEETARLIRLTQTHQADERDEDGRALLDADLAVLGAAPAEYDRYAREIRQEYSWVPEEQYRQGRAAVLERFLSRPRLYFNASLHDSREEQARANLVREIAALRSGAPLPG